MDSKVIKIVSRNGKKIYFVKYKMIRKKINPAGDTLIFRDIRTC